MPPSAPPQKPLRAAARSGFLIRLHQRGEQPQDTLPQPQKRPPAGAVVFRHLPAPGEHPVDVRSDVLHRLAAVEEYVVFKMVVQAPVVQVGGANGHGLPVGDADLGMAEAGGA